MKRFKLLIRDSQNLLNELYTHQIENMIWLRLAHVNEKIKLVKIRFEQKSNHESKAKFISQIVIELASGSTVRVQADCDTRLDSILESTEQMEKQVMRRIAFESGSLFRTSSRLSTFFLKSKRFIANLMLIVGESLTNFDSRHRRRNA
jgi:hypothetical protein